MLISFTVLGFLLLALVSLLVILVPGGPIENRDFSHLNKVTFWGFNIFLVTLGLFTFVLAYFAFLGDTRVLPFSVLAALLYMGVYLLDLFKVFPKSKTPMSNTLQNIEIIDLIVALFVIVIAVLLLSN